VVSRCPALDGCPCVFRARAARAVRVSSFGMRVLIRFGGDLLSHGLSRSTIGAWALNCRVRDGTGCFAPAMTTKPVKNTLGAMPERCSDGARERSIAPGVRGVLGQGLFGLVMASGPVIGVSSFRHWIKSSLSGH
jgi:hypothetical protein